VIISWLDCLLIEIWRKCRLLKFKIGYIKNGKLILGNLINKSLLLSTKLSYKSEVSFNYVI